MGARMEMGSAGDQALLAEALAGNHDALADLFWHFRDRLLAMVRLRLDRRVASRIDPADVLQETFLEVQRRFPDYAADPARMPFFLWLHTLAGQHLLQLHRKHLGAQCRDASLEISIHGGATLAASSVGLAAELAASITSPSQAAMREERRERFQAALNALAPMDLEILALRHFEEFTNDEVAERLGLTKAAASNRYVRALRRLKEQLGSREALP
ncbi:MAG: sigma-70 family RNA polymerase sigma factor [Planctomycetota bacterium]